MNRLCLGLVDSSQLQDSASLNPNVWTNWVSKEQ